MSAEETKVGAAGDPFAEERRMAWLATAVAAWVVGGFTLMLWALDQGLANDVAASPYHIPVYLGIGAAALWLAVRMVTTNRRGLSWRRAVPAGYGFTAAGVVLVLVVIVLDLGWRQGVGLQPGIESDLGPTRVLFGVALVLIAGSPMRAAMVLPREAVPRPAQLASAALVLGVLAWPGGFNPSANLWAERAPRAAGESSELWLMNADGSRQTRLLGAGSSDLGYASWSPSGTMIAYTVFTVPDGDYARAQAAVWVVGADGASPREVTSGDDMRWIPRWSPDETNLVYTREEIGGPFGRSGPEGPGQGEEQAVGGPLTVPLPHADIFRVAADGDSQPEQITNGPGDNRAPVYSPDGAKLLFDTTRDGNTEIYVMDADGSNLLRLTDDPGEDWGASWSPDGRQIAFNSFRTGYFEIYVMNADGSNVRQVTHDRRDDVSPSWSPDGRSLSYTVRGGGTGQVWTVSLETGAQRNISQLPAGTDTAWTGAWGPDGTIVFTRTLPGIAEHASLVRDDLGTASLLVSASMLSGVLVLLARRRQPFGAYATVVTLAVSLAVIPLESWRFIPAGLAVGVIVDLAAWLAPAPLRARFVGSVSGSALVLAAGVVAIAGNGLGWTPSLLLGVATACGAIGWGIGAVGGHAPQMGTATAE